MYLAAPDLDSRCFIPGYNWYCAYKAAQGVTDNVDATTDLLSMVKSIFTDPLGGAVEHILIIMFRWLLIPTSDLFDTSDDSVSATISKWVAPIVAVILICGILWQGFQMAISRKGMPLIRVAKAVLITAAAGGLATAGTAALLTAGDTYSCWVLGEALRGPNTDNANLLISNGRCADNDAIEAVINSQVVDHLGHVLTIPAAFAAQTGIGLVLFPLIGLVVTIAAVVQIFFLHLRLGGMAIMAGVAQLWAAGSITKATSKAPMKWTGVAVLLVSYKPGAATVNATMLVMTDNAGGDSNAEVSNFLTGMTMLVLTPFAMPALIKFFTMGIGALGREGTMAGAATGLDNIGDNLLRIRSAAGGGGGAGAQAQSINASLGVQAGAGAGAVPGAGAGAASGAQAVSVMSITTTTAAGGAAAAAPATGGTSLLVGAVILGGFAATTQIGASLRQGTTDHMGANNL